MEAFHYIVAGGIALGVIQISVGVGIGLWMGRRRNNAANSDLDNERAAQLAADLRGLTDSVASSVRRHSAAIESIDRRLRDETEGVDPTETGGPLTNLVVGIVGQMLGANQAMQQELTRAEDDLKRQAAELDMHRREAMTDALTELPNRRAFDDHLRAKLQAWRTHRTPFCVLMLDIDYFKKFNDTYGHATGDAALKGFGQALASSLRKNDIVCRFGGEEFALLLPHTTLDESVGPIEKVRQAISELRIAVADKSLPITASGGVASIGVGETAEALVERADQALYGAKQAGRDRVFQHDGTSLSPLDATLAADSKPDSQAEDIRDACAALRGGMQQWLEDADSTAVSR